MAHFPRYAIYYAAAHGSTLDRFGEELLGYDAWSGDDLPFPDSTPSDWYELTQDPRKYGFHATLKAPFALAPGKTESDLTAACSHFALIPRPIPVIVPMVHSISGFIAVVPVEPSSALQQFGADCVRVFEPFRAPLTPEDRAPQAGQANRSPACLSRSLRLSLCDRGISVSHDLDRKVGKRKTRGDSWFSE